jgi:voltage-gated potassium channel Kch
MPARTPPTDGAAPRESHRALRAVAAHIRPGSFPLLFAALVLNYVLNGFPMETRAGTLVTLVGHVAIMGASLYVLSASRITVWVGLAMLAASAVVTTRSWTPDPAVARLLQDSIGSCFLLWVLGVVLREVFRPTTSEPDAVVGALTGFLLILSVFMRVHGLVEALSPASYRVDAPPLSTRSDAQLTAVFQYFSTITLTTVGFGDIVPVTPTARLVTGLQSIVGQIYLAVVVATLVSRVAARARS